MFAGLMGGIAWAAATVVLGVALNAELFTVSPQAVFLAPFVGTFLHDAFSALWSAAYNGACGRLPAVWRALKTKDGRMVALAAVIGGPVGMTGYVLAVTHMGAAVGAVASAVYPAVGTVLARVFLKEKMKWYQWMFLLCTLLGVYGLSYSPDVQTGSFWLGVLGAAMCALGWGIEAVILAKSLQSSAVTDAVALQLRQTTSALFYGAVLLPLLGGWGFTADLVCLPRGPLPVIALAGLCATVSYLFYYKAIARIGAARAMALNVTYCAWAVVFAALLPGGAAPTPLTAGCTAVVLVCGVLAATDFQKLLAKGD